jgi:hypothetical protein
MFGRSKRSSLFCWIMKSEEKSFNNIQPVFSTAAYLFIFLKDEAIGFVSWMREFLHRLHPRFLNFTFSPNLPFDTQ